MTPSQIIYFDLIGGASGDMILGALVDAGLELDALRTALAGLDLAGWSLDSERVARRGIAATLVDVHIRGDQPERHIGDLLRIVAASNLPAPVQATATHVLTRLAEAEAHIHAQHVDHVHLHEIGALDTIVDVVGAIAGLHLLGVDRVVVAPFPLARGQMQMAHGRFPLPAPATLALLQGAPVVGVDGERETVTPTAAALLTTLAQSYGTLPCMVPHAIGYGAGQRDDPTPNVLRVVIGESSTRGEESALESIVEIETNIDDMNPQFYDHLMTRLFDAGALDVTLTPMQMKKNRPATWLRVWAPVLKAAELRTIIFDETTTLGVREQIVQRFVLEREMLTVETEFGALRAKAAHRPNGTWTITPEYDDCRRAAGEHHAPLAAVVDAVRRSAAAVLSTRE